MIGQPVNLVSHMLNQLLCVHGAYVSACVCWLLLVTAFEPESHWSI